MPNKSILSLVISSSGRLQNGLLALMTTIPSISAVLVAEDIETALRLVENHQPGLIILDLAEQGHGIVDDLTPSSLKVEDIINEVNTKFPHIHLIALVEDITQQKEVKASGADSVLLIGFSAKKLVAIVENIIGFQEATPPVQANTEGKTNSK